MATDYEVYCSKCKVKSNYNIRRWLLGKDEAAIDFINKHALIKGCLIGIFEVTCYCMDRNEKCSCPYSYELE